MPIIWDDERAGQGGIVWDAPNAAPTQDLNNKFFPSTVRPGAKMLNREAPLPQFQPTQDSSLLGQFSAGLMQGSPLAFIPSINRDLKMTYAQPEGFLQNAARLGGFLGPAILTTKGLGAATGLTGPITQSTAGTALFSGLQPSEAPQLSAEGLKERATNATVGAAINLATIGAVKGIGKTYQGAKNLVTKGFKKPPSPEFLSASIGTSPDTAQRIIQRPKQVLGSITPTGQITPELTQKVQQGMNEVVKQADDEFARIVNPLKQNPKIKVNLDPVAKKFEAELANKGILDSATGKAIESDSPLVTRANKRLVDLLNRVKGKGEVSFKDAWSKKDALYREIDTFSKQTVRARDGIETSMAKRLAGILNEEMETTVPNFSKANDAYEFAATLRGELINKLKNESADNFLSRFYQLQPFFKDRLNKLNSALPKEKQFMEELMDFSAGRELSNKRVLNNDLITRFLKAYVPRMLKERGPKPPSTLAQFGQKVGKAAKGAAALTKYGLLERLTE